MVVRKSSMSNLVKALLQTGQSEEVIFRRVAEEAQKHGMNADTVVAAWKKELNKGKHPLARPHKRMP